MSDEQVMIDTAGIGIYFVFEGELIQLDTSVTLNTLEQRTRVVLEALLEHVTDRLAESAS